MFHNDKHARFALAEPKTDKLPWIVNVRYNMSGNPRSTSHVEPQRPQTVAKNFSEVQNFLKNKLLCIDKTKKAQFTVGLHCSSVHSKLNAQFWDVLFSTISLTCLLSLSFSIIQARINTQHTPVRKSRRERRI